MTKVDIREVCLRDGLQLEDPIPLSAKLELLGAIVATGVQEVEATAFLKNMVRILVGTLIQVGKGRMTVEHVQSLLQSGDRTQAGPTAPAHGLTLRRVDYGPRTGY